MTCWKTVLYWLYDILGGFANTGKTSRLVGNAISYYCGLRGLLCPDRDAESC